MSPRRWVGALSAAVVALALLATPATAHASAGGNKATPRNFTGYGFDQCLSPTQRAMDAWLSHSPYWAVGIYISGNSRACRSQPNLTSTWVSTQLANGWRVLPITLGPQASCSPRFPRYTDDPTIDPRAKNNYGKARKMAKAEALDAMAAAQALGIVPGSTLWYDLEAFDIKQTDCRQSAMWFLSTWTKTLRKEGYVSGVYSSAGSGLKALDDMRMAKPKGFAVPDQVWIARWDGVANTSTSYLREDGWRPGGRMKQYLGDHNETHGGVTINIDSNFLDLGKGSVAATEKPRCGGTPVSFARYRVWPAGASDPQVAALQCLLRQRKLYAGRVTGTMDAGTAAAVAMLQTSQGWKANGAANRKVWMNLHANNQTKLMKYGSTGEKVRRLQRALNAAGKDQLGVTGVLEAATTAAVKAYQARIGAPQTGVVTSDLWSALQQGRR